MRALILSAALTAAAANANEASAKSGDMVSAEGRCKMLQIGNSLHACNKLLYIHFPNGRTGFNLVTPQGSVMLSGSRDRQPTPTSYHLEVDTLRIGDSTGQSRNHQIAGRCEARLSADGGYLHSLQCEAVSGAAPIVIHFVGGGHKVSISHF